MEPRATVLSRAQIAALAALLGLILLAALAWWSTSPAPLTTAASGAAANGSPAGGADSLVDEGSLSIAQRLAPLASGPQEEELSRATLRLADHELDLALTSALSRLESHPPPISDAARRIEARLENSRRLLEADQRKVAQLAAALASAPETARDALELARSQVELDQDEIDEAAQDLEDAGGNLRQRIQKLVQDHAEAQQARVPPRQLAPAATYRGLVGDLRSWLTLRAKQARLLAAADDARARASALLTERRELSEQLDSSKSGIAGLAQHSRESRDSGAAAGAPPPLQNHDDATVLIVQTQEVAADQKVVALLDRRGADLRQLAALYQRWGAVSAQAALATLHGALQDVAIVLALLLLLVLLDRWLLSLFARTQFDRRLVETLRSVTRVALQVVAVLSVLFVVIGLPEQFGTVLGIVGAGLTVALRDFLVAFIGWFVLMGRNGIRLGDWVEINGVGGEVIELGMFHTVLLETGNWSDPGHPTGRRVTFTNSFAIQGHYFNFSTSGQWLWDELQVVVPAGRDPYPIVDAIGRKVREATAASAREAELEWSRAVPRAGVRSFSGAPGLNIKPVVGGVEISVRYLTRANERYVLRASLYQAAVDLLGQRSETIASAAR